MSRAIQTVAKPSTAALRPVLLPKPGRHPPSSPSPLLASISYKQFVRLTLRSHHPLDNRIAFKGGAAGCR
jgi:hypothetical protein